MILYYSTGVRIVNCTLYEWFSTLIKYQVIQPGILCQPIKSFVTKNWNWPIRWCLSNQFRPGRKLLPSPFGHLNRIFEDLIGVLFKIWHWNMLQFLNDYSLAPKMSICVFAVLVKANWMQCPLHNQKVNKPGFHGASCQLAPPNIWAH